LIPSTHALASLSRTNAITSFLTQYTAFWYAPRITTINTTLSRLPRFRLPLERFGLLSHTCLCLYYAAAIAARMTDPKADIQSNQPAG
jgi:hypothetical protein